jgi:hypothetical protein
MFVAEWVLIEVLPDGTMYRYLSLTVMFLRKPGLVTDKVLLSGMTADTGEIELSAACLLTSISDSRGM